MLKNPPLFIYFFIFNRLPAFYYIVKQEEIPLRLSPLSPF